MAEPTWGLLEKSQVDDETIEEAIDRLITAHNDNANAHIGAGKSLNTHKTQAIVDHPKRSLYRDKSAFDRFQIDEHFASIDAWTKSAGVTLPQIAEMNITTTNVANNLQFARIRYGDSTFETENFEQQPVLEVMVMFSHAPNIIAHFEMGDFDDIMGYGFAVHDGNLYVAWYDDDENYHEEQVFGIDFTDYHRYRIDLSDGVNAIWYIDNVQKKTLAFINSRAKTNYVQFYIKTLVNLSKTIYVQSVHYDEDYL